MPKTFSVYMVASRSRVLYIGLTSDLHDRVWKHKIESVEGFSKKYKTKNLVYFENFETFQSALDREKQLKGWRRSKKVALIETANPSWSDLSCTWYSGPAEVLRLTQPFAPAPIKAAMFSSQRSGFAQNDSGWVIVEFFPAHSLLTLHTRDTMNRLTRRLISELSKVLTTSVPPDKPLIITGNKKFFSAGADLTEIAALSGRAALDFARLGQRLTNAISAFPAPTFAAINGYCMGGGLDLALACEFRIASPDAIFGHRGAALGLMTGWGGTQRLPRLIGKARALQMFCAAEKLDAAAAWRVGLINAIAEDPVAAVIARVSP